MDDATLDRGLRARPPADPAYRSRITEVPPTAIRPRPTRARHARPPRVRQMLNAARLVSAVAIVGLGAAALLFASGGGLPSTPIASPSPAPWTPPAGWVTEEVEPGVLHLVSDGVRDLVLSVRDVGADELAIEPDGTIWTASPFRRLGDREPSTGLSLDGVALVRVDADGTPFTAGDGGVHRFDDGDFVYLRPDWEEFDIGPDGSVWAAARSRQSPDEVVLSRLTPSGWEDIPVGVDLPEALGVEATSIGRREPAGLRVGPDGEVWLGLEVDVRTGRLHLLIRFDGDSWHTIDPLGVSPSFDRTTFAIGADGTAWVYFGTASNEVPHLARLLADEWITYSVEDGVFFRPRGFQKGYLEAGHDGTAWMVPGSCEGVRAFDGSAWRRYLESLCVRDLDVAPDGGIWVVGTDGAIYRIDPGVAVPSVRVTAPGGSRSPRTEPEQEVASREP